VSVPFARRCEEAARSIEASLPALRDNPDIDGQNDLDAALTALERSATTLDERSRMQGMAIT
jgi:hypothetical protein